MRCIMNNIQKMILPKKQSNSRKDKKISTIKKLFSLTVPHYKKILLALLFVLIINVVQIIKPYILKVVIDDFLIKRMSANGLYSVTSMSILYLTLSLISAILIYFQVNIINRVGQKIIKNLRGRVFKTIQALPLHYLDKTSSGRLITRATNDVNELNDLYSEVLISLFKDVFLLVGIVSAMFLMNVELTLISFIVIPIMAYIVVKLKTKLRANFVDMKHYVGKINGFMAETISGMKIIQIFRGEKEKQKEFLEINNDYMKTTFLQVKYNSLLKPAAELFQSFATALLLWYGMTRITNQTLELGVLYAFTVYIRQFFNPISDLAEKYTSIQSALVSTDRIFDLLDEKEILEDTDIGLSLDTIHGEIEFKNVWFSYDNEEWVLKDVSFKVKKGETFAFVGETGAGKSTIINLINGFYKIQKGEILIDGININDIKLKDLRKNISVVLQDSFLFSGDIYMNVALNNDIDEKEIQEFLDLSCASSFINNFEKGIHTPVMERGNNFSSGQKQLLSFARAIAQKPSVIILDEATANIDTHTEKLIQRGINNITKDRTTLIIAHRLSTIRSADKIIVLKDGEIVEAGSDQELIDNGGYYKSMLVHNYS